MADPISHRGIIAGCISAPRENRIWPSETKTKTYWSYYHHSLRNINIHAKGASKTNKSIIASYCKKLKNYFKTCMHNWKLCPFLSKKFMLVNAVNIQIHTWQWILLMLRIILPVLAQISFDSFLVTTCNMGRLSHSWWLHSLFT